MIPPPAKTEKTLRIPAVVLVLLYVKKKTYGKRSRTIAEPITSISPPLLHQARELRLEFKTMMKHRKGDELVNCYQKAGQLSLFKIFVKGIFHAVQEGLSSTLSNGQTEGQVNKLKTSKYRCMAKPAFTDYGSEF